MKMIIEEKIDNFQALLWRCYEIQKKEHITINHSIVETYYPNHQELELICDNLFNRGVLRQQPTFLRIPDSNDGETDAIIMEEMKDKPGFYILKSPYSYEFAINVKKLKNEFGIHATQNNKLKSIHLITDSLEPRSIIFLVLDEQYSMPVRCSVKNKDGQPTYIKKFERYPKIQTLFLRVCESNIIGYHDYNKERISYCP